MEAPPSLLFSRSEGVLEALLSKTSQLEKAFRYSLWEAMPSFFWPAMKDLRSFCFFHDESSRRRQGERCLSAYPYDRRVRCSLRFKSPSAFFAEIFPLRLSRFEILRPFPPFRATRKISVRKRPPSWKTIFPSKMALPSLQRVIHNLSWPMSLRTSSACALFLGLGFFFFFFFFWGGGCVGFCVFFGSPLRPISDPQRFLRGFLHLVKHPSAPLSTWCSVF